MQLDRNAVERLLSMNDAQLKFIITKLAVERGLDLSTFNITGDDINSIRYALKTATDADLARATEQLTSGKKKK